MYVNGNNGSPSYNAIYFERFGVEYIPSEIKNFIGNKSIITNIYWIQTYDLIMSGNFCIGFIDFIVKGKSLLDYKFFFCPNECEKMMNIIFCIYCHYLIHKFQSFVKLLQMVHQLIQNYQKLRRIFRYTFRTITRKCIAFNEKCT